MTKSRNLAQCMRGISNNVNICRFLAAALVIFSHAYPLAVAGQSDWLNRATKGQCNFGGISVTILFFFSGLYVTKSIEKKSGFVQYFSGRCKRIFPPLMFVVGISAFVLGPIITTVTQKAYFSSTATWLYLLNGILLPVHNLPGVFLNSVYARTVNGPLWTMPVEFGCYVALFIFYHVYKHFDKKAGKSVRLSFIVGIVLLGAICLKYITAYIIPGAAILAEAIRPAMAFLMGVLYYAFREKIYLNKWAAIVSLMILALAVKTPFFSYPLVLLLPYIVTTFTLGVPQIQWRSHLFNLSYEMYLVGFPIQQVFTCCLNIGKTPLSNFLISLPVDIAVAGIVYMLTEKH